LDLERLVRGHRLWRCSTVAYSTLHRYRDVTTVHQLGTYVTSSDLAKSVNSNTKIEHYS